MNDVLNIARERKKRMEERSSEVDAFVNATEAFLRETDRRREYLSGDFKHLDDFLSYGKRVLRSASARLDALRREARRAESFISYAEKLLNIKPVEETEEAAPPQRMATAQERPTRQAAGATRDYFAGEWQMVRIIEDVRKGVIGEFWGQARFTSDNEGLTCRESGVLRFAGKDSHTGNTTLWRFSDDGRIEVRYEDGRPFHDFLPHDPIARSVAGDVESRISYEFDEDTWLSTWQLLTPDEEYVMTTRYRR